MDRKLLIELFQDGMKYSPGKHRLWVSRCFEITVRPDKIVELDEYEGFAAQETCGSGSEIGTEIQGCKKMFHVGRSILHLKNGQVIEKTGVGWKMKANLKPSIKKT